MDNSGDSDDSDDPDDSHYSCDFGVFGDSGDSYDSSNSLSKYLQKAQRNDLKNENKQEQIQSSPSWHIKWLLESLAKESTYFLCKIPSRIHREIQREITKTMHDLSILCSAIRVKSLQD